jgi:hypothetical protein
MIIINRDNNLRIFIFIHVNHFGGKMILAILWNFVCLRSIQNCLVSAREQDISTVDNSTVDFSTVDISTADGHFDNGRTLRQWTFRQWTFRQWAGHFDSNRKNHVIFLNFSFLNAFYIKTRLIRIFWELPNPSNSQID